MNGSASALLTQLGLNQLPAPPDSLFGDDDISSIPRRQASVPANSVPRAESPSEPRTSGSLSGSLLLVPAAASVTAVADPLSSIVSGSPPSPKASPVASADVIEPLGAMTRAVPPREHPAPPGLFPGERLSAPPVPARRLPDAALQASTNELGMPVPSPPVSGRLYVTNWRMLWEATAAAAADEELPASSRASVSIPFYSIDRFIKYTKRSSSAVQPADTEIFAEVLLKYGAVPALRVLAGAAAFGRLSAIIHDARCPGYDQIFATLHAAAVTAASASVEAGASRRHSEPSLADPLCAAAPPAAAPVPVGPPQSARSGSRTDRGAVAGGASSCHYDYQPEAEFHRQGLNNPLSHWRVTRLNERFGLCGTYPRLLVVPRSISDEALARAAAFRSGRRLPVLCWKDAFGVASISRCSQPLVGVANKRSPDDEALLRAIADTNPFGETLHIIDCRPKLNADMNQVKGKGYEHPSHYASTRVTFMNIENIHVMRTSLRAFVMALGKQVSGACTGSETSLTELERTGWLEHLRMVLRAARHTARLIHVERSSVLVHCSDGWDRTPQVTALAQLLLDPTFRTLAGFEQLLAKEWLSFGHQFAKRCGTIAPFEKGAQSSEEQLSPVFLQYIDCCHQLCVQFPSAFEYNSVYLAELLHQLLSCQYGTLLANCERQRADLPPTRPLWPALAASRFTNHCFQPGVQLVLSPDPGAVRPWTAYYCRGAERLRAEQLPVVEARLAQLADENQELRRRLRELAGAADECIELGEARGGRSSGALGGPPLVSMERSRRAGSSSSLDAPSLEAFVPFEEEAFVAPSFEEDAADVEP